MSSVDSTLLLCSAAAEGLYIGYINPNASAKQQLRVGRAITVVVAAVAMVMAFSPYSHPVAGGLLLQHWAGAFTVPVLFALCVPGTTKTAGFCAMAAGCGGPSLVRGGLYHVQQFFQLALWHLARHFLAASVSDRDSGGGAHYKAHRRETREIFYLDRKKNGIGKGREHDHIASAST